MVGFLHCFPQAVMSSKHFQMYPLWTAVWKRGSQTHLNGSSCSADTFIPDTDLSKQSEPSSLWDSTIISSVRGGFRGAQRTSLECVTLWWNTTGRLNKDEQGQEGEETQQRRFGLKSVFPFGILFHYFPSWQLKNHHLLLLKQIKIQFVSLCLFGLIQWEGRWESNGMSNSPHTLQVRSSEGERGKGRRRERRVKINRGWFKWFKERHSI